MSLEHNATEFCNEYVKALCDYEYVYKDQQISMSKGELFLLIRKATEDWWQVIRKGDKRSFFAPRQYLQLSEFDGESQRHSLRKKIAHQRHLQNEQRLFEEARKLQCSPPVSKENNNKDLSNSSLVNSENHNLSVQMESINAESQQKEVSNEALVVINPIFQTLNDSQENSQIDNHLIQSPPPHDQILDSVNANLVDSPESPTIILNVCADRNFSQIANQQSSNMIHQSASNTTVSSSFGKNSLSSEIDYSSSHTSKSSLNEASRGSSDSLSSFLQSTVMVSKAASIEIFHSSHKDDIPLEIGNQKAASSEELDNHQRVREIEFKSNRLSQRNRSNSVDLKRFDNSLDLSDCEKQASLDKVRKYRLSKDPMNRRRSWALNESNSWVSFPKCVIKDNLNDAPPKLPPKQKIKSYLLGSSYDNSKKQEEQIEVKIDEMPRKKALEPTLSVSQIKREFETNIQDLKSNKASDIGSKPIALPRKVLNSVTPSEHKTLGKETEFGFLDAIEKAEVSDKIVSDPQDRNLTDSSETKYQVNQRFKEASKKIILLSKNKETGIDKIVKEIEKKEKDLEINKSKSALKLPPSPTDPPIRHLFDDWGEYLEENTQRIYFYNVKTQEKRWKPPRRSVPSSKPFEDRSPPISKEHLNISGQRIPKAITPPALSSSVYPSLIPPGPHRERSFTCLSNSPYSSRPSRPFDPNISFLPSVAKVSEQNFKVSSTLPSQAQPLASNMSKTTHTLPVATDKDQKSISPTAKSTRSIFSSITSSFSFMKNASNTNTNTNSHLSSQVQNRPLFPLSNSASTSSLPQVPPMSAKPALPTDPENESHTVLHHSPSTDLTCEDDERISMKFLLEDLQIPKGWVKKFDALSQQIYFQSLATGEKWFPALDNTRKVYFYPADGGNSEWTLPEHSSVPDSPSVTEVFQNVVESPVEEKFLKEDYVTWSLFSREGKKLRKNWNTAWLSYLSKVSSKSHHNVLKISKTPEESKKTLFEFVPPCAVDNNILKKTTKPNVLCIQNGSNTELLLQFKDADQLNVWFKCFKEHDNVLEKDLTPEKEKKSKKYDKGGPLKKDSGDEIGSPNDKGFQSFFKSYLKKRPPREVLVKKGIYKEAVFGSTIAELCSKEGPFIPLFVLKCLQNIEKNRENFSVDGLYRICGNAARIQKIRYEVGQNRYGILEEEKDVHNLTGALKLFFRELKEPLIPFDSYTKFIRASEYSRIRTRAEALRDALSLLPRCNHDTLKLLLEHLLKVNQHEQENRMSIMNLAVVFGPCLLWPVDPLGIDLMTDVMLQNRVIEALLSEYSKIYKDSKIALP